MELNNFTFEVLEECTRSELNAKEVYWISFYHSYVGFPSSQGYNLTLGGEGVQGLKKPHSEATKARLSKSWDYNKHITPEFLTKLSKAHKGRKLSPTHVEGIRKSNLSKVRAPEQKAIYSKAACRRYEAPYERELTSVRFKKLWEDPSFHSAHSGENHPWYGRYHTEESKAKNE